MMWQFTKFLVVGAAATVLQYGLLIILVEATALPEVAASALAFAFSAVANYLANYYFTFQSGNNHRQSASRFALVALISLGINTWVFWGGLQFLPHYLLAQIIATGVTMVVNFTLHRLWTFRP